MSAPSDAVTRPRDDAFAVKLRGFGPVGIASLVVITLLGPIMEPLGGLLALLWAYRSRTPWRELGFAQPRSWALTILLGLVLGFAFKLLMKSLVLPVLGAPDINPVYHYLAGNTAALPSMVFDILVGAGFAEETVFRGFLFERLGKLLGQRPWAKITILLITSVLFGLVHYPGQGLYGALQALFTGLLLGALYLITKRLWLSMVTHVAFDLTAVFIIYRNLETQAAHLLFK
jgi:CAAX protease family protein